MEVPPLGILAVLLLIGSVTACHAEIDCSVPKNQKILHPHPGSCNLYIQCINGILLERSCPAGTEFSHSLRWCVHEWESDCVIEANGDEEGGTTEGEGVEEDTERGEEVTQSVTAGISDAVSEEVSEGVSEEDVKGETTTEVTENVTDEVKGEDLEDGIVDEENDVEDEQNDAENNSSCDDGMNDENAPIDPDLEENENDADENDEYNYKDYDDYYYYDDNNDDDNNDDNNDDNTDNDDYDDFPNSEIEDELDNYIPTPEEICQAASDRFFYSYHPSDCTAYIICHFGRVIQLQCSIGEYFNAFLLSCVKNSGQCISMY